MIRWSAVAAVGALALLLCGGCGSSGSNSATAGSGGQPDACQLVTPSDIQTDIGAAPLTPAKTNTPGECAYASATEYNYVDVTVEENQTMAEFERSASASGPTNRVTGLGDEAFQSGDGGSIFVLSGTTYVRIDVFGTSIDAGAVQTLATTAVGRLNG